MVKEADVLAVMASYNHICMNEQRDASLCPAAGTQPTKAPTNKYLQTTVLKEQLGFRGQIMTDWLGYGEPGASADAGLDLQMPGYLAGPGLLYKDSLAKAVADGEVSMSRVDDMVRRALRVHHFTGYLDTGYTERKLPNHSPDKAVFKRVSYMTALQSMVLMKNEGAHLPLKGGSRVTLIGQPWRYAAVAGGGSSVVPLAPDIQDPMDVVAQYAGAGNVTFKMGKFVHGNFAPSLGVTMDVKKVTGTVYADGEKILEFPKSYHDDAGTYPSGVSLGNADPDARLVHEVLYEFTPYESGPYVFDVTSGTAMSKLEFRVAGTETWQVFWDVNDEAPTVRSGLLFGAPVARHYSPRVELTKGTSYELRWTRNDFALLFGALSRWAAVSIPPTATKAEVSLGRPPLMGSTGLPSTDIVYPAGANELGPDTAKYLQEAIAAAAQAYAAGEPCLVAVGSNSDVESEGSDRFATPGVASSGPTLTLPQDQDALVNAVLDANPNAIVVLNTGSVVTMPWYSRAKTVVSAGFFGDRGAEALVDLLYGKTSFSGKTVATWPKQIEDVPGYADYVAYTNNFNSTFENTYGAAIVYKGTHEYSQGIYYGYKGYAKANKAVEVPFGHGLSYTTFAHSGVGAAANDAAHTCDVTFTLANTGDVSGMEVTQLYVSSPSEPVKQLRDFVKTPLAAGESKTITMTLPMRAFASWDTPNARWHSEAGTHTVHVGTSSAGPFHPVQCSFTAPLTAQP
jgi:beta-glucosidase